VAVDPAAKKIVNWSLVEKGLNSKAKVDEIRGLIKNGQCGECGKKTSTTLFGGQQDFCSAACAQKSAEAFNKVEQVKVPDTAKAGDKPQLVCGCARVGLFHGQGCASNKAGERIAENVRWSEKDPRFMKPDEEPDQKPMTRREAQLNDARERQRANPVKKKWSDGLWS
jgi:hypothetical protein